MVVEKVIKNKKELFHSGEMLKTVAFSKVQIKIFSSYMILLFNRICGCKKTPIKFSLWVKIIFCAHEIKIFALIWYFYILWNHYLHDFFKMTIEFQNRMIITQQNDTKFTEIGKCKEKLMTLKFPLTLKSRFLFLFFSVGTCLSYRKFIYCW